ncbi:hypothetical protein G6F56_003358 [Rhizopus delemar]|nr:hypothetical protein G6F56_003358 [Rhizopus delemar]
MSTSDSSNAARGPYLPLEEKVLGHLLPSQARCSLSGIKGTVEMPMSTVHNIIKRIEETGRLLPKKQPEASKKIDQRASRHLQRVIREDPFAPYAQLQMELNAMDIMVSRQTVIACLKSLGFGFCFVAHKPRLTEVNMKKRFRWAMEHVNWTEDQWKSVVWSDKPRFSLNGNNADAGVIRKVGERYQARHVIPTTVLLAILVVKLGGGKKAIKSEALSTGLLKVPI